MLAKYNLTPTRTHAIMSDYGIIDYYKYYRKHGGDLSYQMFSKILRDFNNRVAEIIVNNEYSYKLPAKMGVITLVKKKNFVKFRQNKVVTNYPVNYKATGELWERDPEAKAAKKLIRYDNRHSNKFSYHFKYLTSQATYTNKSIYKMTFNRQKLKYKVRDLIFKEGELERGLAK